MSSHSRQVGLTEFHLRVVSSTNLNGLRTNKQPLCNLAVTKNLLGFGGSYITHYTTKFPDLLIIHN